VFIKLKIFNENSCIDTSRASATASLITQDLLLAPAKNQATEIAKPFG
jgi:hypothetical protein